MFKTLHSILVIFQLIGSIVGSVVPGVFTFHSGYIPIKTAGLKAALSALYIPFWLYSNTSCSCIFSIKYLLYIPFWLYSNPCLWDWKAVHTDFTFHSGYIPMQSEHFTLRLQAFFTFHSGYIPMKAPFPYHQG